MPELSVEERVDKIGVRLSELKARLEKLGYSFRMPEQTLPGPVPNVDEALDRLWREVGPVPLALDLFYRRVGSVNFTGEHPSWEGCAYPDPLVVLPIRSALQELDTYLSDRQNYRHAFGSYRVPIAPDYCGKEDESGGMWSGIALPDATEDPLLLEEWHDTTFLGYIENAIRWGGFPGLERWCSEQHNWPIAELTRV